MTEFWPGPRSFLSPTRYLWAPRLARRRTLGFWPSPHTFTSPTAFLTLPRLPRPAPTPLAYLIRRPGLGCGRYSVLAYERGGTTVIHELPVGTIQWERVLSRTGQATMTSAGLASAIAADCCRRLRDIRCWEAELHVYRDDARVWLGPLVQRTVHGGLTVELVARDLSQWLWVRPVWSDETYVGVETARIAEQSATAAIGLEVSPNITIRAAAGSPTGDYAIAASDDKIAGDVIDDLARAGLDWWAVRRIVQFGLGQPPPALGVLLDTDFVEVPDVTDDGLGRVTRAIVRGAQPDPAPDALAGDPPPARIRGEASQPSDATGLLVRVYDESTIESVEAATSAAATHIASSQATATVIAGGQLDPSAPLALDRLVPGGIFDVRVLASCIPATGPHVLTRLSGSADAQGEKLSVDLVAQSLREEAG